jgi:alpha/beta superfamily hydrolase
MIQHIPGPAGVLEALVDDPRSLCTTASPTEAVGPVSSTGGGDGDARRVEPPTAAVVLAHPHPQYGGTMHTKAVYQAAKAFCRLGCAVLRFNFRGVGVSDGEYSGGEGELADYRAGLDFMAARFPRVPLWAAGVSFGSWVAMTVGADDARVMTLVGIAVPAGLYDFSAVKASGKPKFFIHGEHDEICPLRAVWDLYGKSSEPKELVVVDGADHLFDGHVSEVADAITDLLG